jgi:mRNA interferase MazF
MAMVVSRFDVFLVNLNPTQGHEIKKTRPCLIISPDEMNVISGQRSSLP